MLAVLLASGSLVVAGASAAVAVSAVLDPTWGGTGTVSAPFAGRLVPLSDGTLYVVANTTTSNNLRVAHLLADGSLDSSFGVAGVVSLAIPTVNYVADVKAMSGGQLVILLRWRGTGVPTVDGVVVRMTTAGALDPSFAAGGIRNLTFLRTTTPYICTAQFEDLDLGPGGEVFVAGLGFTYSGGGYSYCHSNFPGVIAKFTSAGGVDTSFNTTGNIKTSDYRGVTALSDGKVLTAAVGSIARLMPNGSPDPSFTTVPRGAEMPGPIVISPATGGITLFGIYDVSFYNANGSADATHPSFGPGPIAGTFDTTTTGSTYYASAGSSTDSVRRITAGDRADSGFGTNGALLMPFARVGSLAVDSSGRVLVADAASGTIIRWLKREASIATPTAYLLGAPVGSTAVVDPVDTASGNLTDSDVDLAAGVFGLDVTRSYNGLSTETSTVGARWWVSTGPHAEVDGDGVAVVLPEGTRFRFAPDGAGGYVTPNGTSAVLSVDSATPTGGGSLPMLRLLHKDGNVDRFDTGGRLLDQSQWDGETATTAYDGSGLVTSVTSSGGQFMTFSYDASSRLIGIALSTGRSVSYAYNGTGMLAGFTDEHGAATGYNYTPEGWLKNSQDATGVTLQSNVYDALGRVISQTNPTGGTTTFNFIDSEAVTEVTNSLTGAVVQYHHDATGRVVAVSDPFGFSAQRVYDGHSNLVTSQDRNTSETTVTYDAHNNVTSVIKPATGTTGYTYDVTSRVTSMTDPSGAVTTYAYDGNERLPSTVTDGLGHVTTDNIVNGLTMSSTDADGVTTTNTYDGNRQLTSTTDGAGNTTTYTYDGSGRRTSARTPAGNTTTWTYDTNGRLASTTAADGGVTSYTYDQAGRTLTTTDPTGAVTTNNYTAAGVLASVTDPAGHATTFATDADGHVTGTVAPGGGTSTTEYGALSRVVSTTDQLDNTTRYAYDADGRTTAVTDPSSAVTHTTFDGAGRVAETDDPAGRATTTAYDAHGRVLTATAPSGVTAYTYDTLGRTATVTDPRGGVATTTYTPAGRIATTTDAASLTTTIAYDAAGRRKTVTGPGSRATTVTYTSDGYVASVASPSGNVTHYTYDTVGHVATMTDPAGVVTTRTYTLRGQLATQRVGVEGPVSYVYNPDGTTASVTDPLGHVTAFAYDERGNMTSRTNSLGGVDSWTFNAANQVVSSFDPLNRETDFGYDPNGRITSSTDPASATTTNTYNPDGTIATETTALGTNTYGYDAAGRVSSISGPDGVTSYAYTPAGDLLSSTTGDRVIGYGYDVAGRRTMMRYPDGNTVRYSYDATGDLTNVAPGELMADTFTQPNAQTPIATKWTPTVVAAATASIQSDTMLLTVPNAATAAITESSKVATALDHEVTFGYHFSSVDPLNSAKLTLAVKYTAANHYRIEISSGSPTASIIRKIGASTTTVGTFSVPPTTDTTRIRFQVAGTSLRVRTWADGAVEPMAWSSTITASPAVTTSGSVRVSLTRATGTNSVAIDDWSQSNPTTAPAAIDHLTYNADDQVTNETLPGGTRTRTFTAGKLTGFAETVPGLTQSTALAYDTTGRVVADTTGTLSTAYTYDAGSQLLTATPSTGTATAWNYDALGRRATEKIGTVVTKWVYDAAGQTCWTTTKTLPVHPSCTSPLTGATTFTWDQTGRLTGQTVTATSKVAYAYDAAGRLATISRLSGSTATTQQRTYQSDGNLAGAANTVVTPTTTTNTSTGIDWDNSSGIPRPIDFASAGVATDLTSSPGGWASAQLGLKISPLGLDAYGSAIPTTGTTAIARNATFTAYGKPVGTNTFEPRLGYLGNLAIDNQLDLHARNYQPDIATFTSRDLLPGTNGSTTLADPYHYADNNPLNRSDPTGLSAISDSDGFGIPKYSVTHTARSAAVAETIADAATADALIDASVDEIFAEITAGLSNDVLTASIGTLANIVDDTVSFGSGEFIGTAAPFVSLILIAAPVPVVLQAFINALRTNQRIAGQLQLSSDIFNADHTNGPTISPNAPPTGLPNGTTNDNQPDEPTPQPATDGSHSGNSGCATNSFEPSDKHDQVRPGVGAQPRNGQAALDRSVQVSDTSSRRVGVDAASGEIVVFDETFPGQCIFHGHVRTWDQLTQKMQSALYKAGLTNLKGRIM